MGFAGNLRTLSLPEVVQTLARIQATGILRLAADGGHRDVVFNAGQIVGVDFTTGAERQVLLQRMIMQGKLDANAAAAISAAGSESQVVRSLVEQGSVSEDDVLDAQANQAEEELISLCTWEAADFVFHDAGPEEPEALELVEKFVKLGLSINSGSLLMEAARRMDEWSRLKERLPDSAVVYGVANDKHEELTKAATDYPAVAVVPLIDAVRTIEDIVQDAVITRLEVYQVLVALLERGLICQLSREDLIAHADYWKEQHNNQLAAKLYRRALAQFPGDRETQIKLGACLEYLGDSDEAAQCYGQLALGCLDEGDPNRACEFSRHAITLRPNDPKLRQILARSHFMRSDEVAAINELREVVRIYLDLGQLEDARGTCLKILELNHGDEFARRELARIFSRVEKDQQSEDVVVCVQCGTVNHREAQTCEKCHVSLQLGCLSCHRVVSVSDRLCIFCGANPHAGSTDRRAGGSPTTSRIINRNGQRKTASNLVAAVQSAEQGVVSGPRAATAEGAASDQGSGAERWKIEHDRHLSEAQANEEAGNIEAALTSWREVAKLQSDNPQILLHIRELELQVNQQAIEQHIDLGHRLNRTRHPWKASRSYRKALHLMSADDPRIKPVMDALARSERDQRKIGLIYGTALAAVAIAGFVAIRPYYQISQFTKAKTALVARIEAVPGLGAGMVGSEAADIAQELDRLAADAGRIRGTYGETAKREENELRMSLNAAKSQAATRSMEAIIATEKSGNVTQIQQALSAFQADFGTAYEEHRFAQVTARLNDLKKQLKIKDDARKEAPAKLALLQKNEEDKLWSSALAGYRELLKVSDPEVLAQAQAGVDRLAGPEAAFQAEWSKALALAGTDLAKASQAFSTLAASARLWGRETEQIQIGQEIQARLKAAEDAYAALSENAAIPELEKFVATHGAAPQAAQARARISTLAARAQGRDQALALFKQQVSAKQYEQAWQTGHDLVAGFGALLAPGQVKLPFVIESTPSGATVSMGGKALGKTPMVLSLNPAYAGQEADAGELSIAASGWQAQTVQLEDGLRQWRTMINLQRQALWQIALGKAVGAAYPQVGGGVMILAGDAFANLDQAGRVKWRHALGGDDLGGGRSRLAHAPVSLPDGKMAFGLPGSGISIIDGQGNPVQQIATAGEIRGRPLVYANDVFGADTRLAFAGDFLQASAIGAEPSRIPLSAPAIAGPLALDRDLDKVLVIGNVAGHLLGILEQPRKVVWDIDLQATDISQLQPITDNLVITVLDGSKLVALQIRPEMAAVSWSHQLKAPAIGEPALTTNGIVVAAGSTVMRFGRDGTLSEPWPLPAPASSPVATNGELVAVGTQSGMLMVYRGEKLLWSTPCAQPVTAVAILKTAVVAGLADGNVIAFAP